MTTERRWKIIDWAWPGGALELSMGDDCGGGQWAVADFSKVTLTTITVGSLAPPGSALRLTEDDAQQIMNELWRVGIRPRGGEGSVAQVDALQRHLADMRKIALSRLGLDDEAVAPEPDR